MTMKKTILLLFVCMSSMVFAQNATSVHSNQLNGIWQIDLRPTPDSEAYFKQMTIQITDDNTFNGTFYDSTFKKGFLNTSWPNIYFAFSTKDKSNTYYHSGYFDGNTLHGVTYCPNREFTAPWTGTKE